MVSRVTESINISTADGGTIDYAKTIDGLSLNQAKLLLNMQKVNVQNKKDGKFLSATIMKTPCEHNLPYSICENKLLHMFI